jgi:acyl carrier protein
MSDTLDRLNRVFQSVFDDDELVVAAGTTAQDVDGWDSMMHVRLLINVERAFGLKFSFSEMAGLKNVGELVALIDRKLAAKA